MNTTIVPIQNQVLKEFIQYFIFFNHNLADSFSYQTFPNTNLCLAIYKENEIDYRRNKNENICTISYGRKAFSSCFFGFHEQPFKVNINTALDQVCILFHPAGLRAFTQIPYNELINERDVFNCLFKNNGHILELVFEESDLFKRAALLEAFLLKNLETKRLDFRANLVLEQIYSKRGNVTVYELSKLLKVNESTLYRSFSTSLGQSPKDFIQTVRFRNALSLLLKHQYKSLTELTYLSMFYDQSHFIKDFKKRSGLLPNSLHKNIQLEQSILAWIVSTD